MNAADQSRANAALAGILSFGAVFAVAAMEGGYFPTSWGWTTLGLLWVCVAVLLTRSSIRLGALEVVSLAALATLTGWTVLSLLWTESVPLTMLEVERSLVPLAGLAAALAVCRRAAAPALASGVLAAGLALAVWALVLGVDEPLGYANALALMCVIATVLVVGCALERRDLVALTAAPAVIVLLVAIGRTDSRAAWLALAAGIGVGLALRLPRSAVAVAAALAASVVIAGLAGATGSEEREAYWQVALKEATREPLLGSGAGTWRRVWLRHREVPFSARDAHSLYLETLSELGPVGLALLVGALAAPVAAAVRARERPLVPAAAGAYAAFLVHAGVDWDWEVTAVALAAVFLGASLLVSAREPPEATALAPTRRPQRPVPIEVPRGPALAVAVATAVLAAGALVGNVFTARAENQLRAGDWGAAERAAGRAARVAPWAAEPWRLRGEAEAAQGRWGAAAASFGKGLSRDAGDVELWRALSRVTTGSELRHARARAAQLDPLGTG